VGKHTLETVVSYARLAGRWFGELTGPEGNKETKPSEEEDTAIDVDYIKDRNRPGFLGDGVHIRC
jgi:hypothetical protein